MTIIVGIRCKDGVVIGADSAATFGAGPGQATIEQPTDRKIEIIGDQVIVAGTGFVGHQQRFVDCVRGIYDKNNVFGSKKALDIARALSKAGAEDFINTHAVHNRYGAIVAYRSSDSDFNLCELVVDGFQPELKEPNSLWWTAMGNGQGIVDPFLALLGKVFWSDGPPSLRGGIFTALWALEHACEINVGGIQKPIHIATLKFEKGKVRASKLDPDALAEHENMIKAATLHLRSFRDVLEGAAAEEVPKVPPTPTPTPASKPASGTILPGLPGHKPQS